MPADSAQNMPLWPLAAYVAAVVVMVGGVIALAYVLGERGRGRGGQVPYESGIEPTGSARLRLTAKFYLIAMFFVVFDLEAVFIFAWVIAFKELGWAGYVEIVIFIAVLMAGLVYLWRQGALDWGSGRGSGKLKTRNSKSKTNTNEPISSA